MDRNAADGHQKMEQVATGQPDELPFLPPSLLTPAAVLAALRQGSLSVLDLVTMLQRPLTDDMDHEGRARAVQLLSQLAAEAPEALKPGDVGVLAEFLASKLTDWRCVGAAVPGCLSLLQRRQQPSLAPLPEADAVKLVSRLVKVHVQGLDYKGRLACYELLLELMQGPFAVPCVLGGTDLASFTVVAMENEADPRCLLLALQCVEAVGRLYHQPTLASSVTHLQDNIEDLFDACAAPYFPVIFNAPKHNPHAITRDMLLQRVLAAMAACPEFAPLAIPVLSEKLGSSLRQAKEDSLVALPLCLRSWGPAAVKPHLQAVWLMLKSELMAPAAVDDRQQPEALAPKQQLAARAAASLQASVAALGPGLLDQQVLNDVAVEDLMQYLGLVNPPWEQQAAAAGAEGVGSDGRSAGAGGAAGGGEEGWHLPQRAQRRLACIAGCVAAVVGAGGGCSAAACSAVLEPAVAAVLRDTAPLPGPASAAAAAGRQARPLQANCGVLCVLHQSLAAVAAAAAAKAPGSDASGGQYAAVSALLPQVVTMLQQLQELINQQQQQQQQQQEGAAAGCAGSSSSNGVSGGLQVSKQEEAWQCQQLQLWVLLLWQDLLSLPAAVSQLQQQQLAAAAEQLLLLALHGSSEEAGLELAPGSSASPQAAAAAALVKVAAWPPSAGSSETTAAAAAGEVGGASAGVGMRALSSCADQLLQLLRDQALDAPAVPSTTAAAGGDAAGGGGGVRDRGLLRARAVDLLGLLAGSGPGPAWQVLQWLQEQVLLHVRQGAWAQLNTVLPVLNHSCLPALPQDLTPQHSAEAAAFCGALVEAWQQQQQQEWVGVSALQAGSSGSSQELPAGGTAVLNSCLLVGQLTARCSLDDHRRLLLPVCAWVTQAAAAAAAAATAGSSEQMEVDAAGPVCIALSVLAGARPGLLTAPSTLDLVQSMASLAVCSSSSSWIDSTAAAAALGGVLNKSLGVHNQQQRQRDEGRLAAAAADGSSAIVQPEQLLPAVLPVLTQPLHTWQQQQQQQQQVVSDSTADAAAAAAAVRALSWTARGLALQRHDGWQGIMQQWVLPVLLAGAGGAGGGMFADGSPALHEQQPAAAAGLSPLVLATAEFFSILVSPAEEQGPPAAASSSNGSSSEDSMADGAGSLGRQLSLHSMARPLWQQKAFVLAAEALQQAAEPAQQQGAEQGQGVWLALASLISAAPAALPAAGQPQVLLLQCVLHLLKVWTALQAAGQSSSSSEGDQAGHQGGVGGGGDLGLVGAQVQLLRLLRSCLLLLGDALSSGGQGVQEEFAPCVELLLQTLCSLAVLQPSQGVAAGGGGGQQQQKELRRRVVQLAAGVREVGVMCLTSCMALPYHLLHPHRRAVLAAVMLALDDDRRAVRRAAVLCRAAWFPS